MPWALSAVLVKLLVSKLETLVSKVQGPVKGIVILQIMQYFITTLSTSVGLNFQIVKYKSSHSFIV